MLLHYYNLGLDIIASIRPDALNYRGVSIPLVPGTEQDLPDYLTSIASINGPNGPLAIFDSDFAGVPDDPCQEIVAEDCDGKPLPWEPIGYTYNAGSGTISIYPPVPSTGGPYSVTLYGGLGPAVDENQDVIVTGRYLGALEAWMLHKAYEVDTESVTSPAMSSAQYKIFKDLLYGSLQVEVALKNNKAFR